MEFTAQKIAEILKGEVEGNQDVNLNKLSKIEEGEEGSLSFLANPKYKKFIYSTNASAVIVAKNFTPEKPISTTLIKVDDPYSAFAQLLDFYNQIKLNKTGISKMASIPDSAKIGKNVYIGDFVVIGENVVISENAKIYPQTYIGDNVKIGENSMLFAGIKIYSECEIGKNCTIHAGVVIGSDGFGFAPQSNNNYKKIAQIGNVLVEDNVEIGSNTTIDRATLGSTIIRKGVKLDNLIQIAHNVEIGENTVIASQTGISGSTKIGKNCMIGGQVGIIGHLIIADEVKIAAQSGLSKNILKKGSIVQGSPAFEVKKYMHSYIHFRNLNNIVDRINELEKKHS
ncbi:MAG: UDP-3-O-(3-hydroxymyristoyl)glucosamine N-acyltransferase [Bacteroidales bacterium]|nr:UDP-3-O-(3-hydroxymyristoyl)glucosamine N-acyltransferase [Bacteroidales bacterium]